MIINPIREIVLRRQALIEIAKTMLYILLLLKPWRQKYLYSQRCPERRCHSYLSSARLDQAFFRRKPSAF